MEHYLQDRVVIVTGGSSGFGLESARTLLDLGARVVITGRNVERLAAAEADLGGGKSLLAVRADATVTADWQRLTAAVVERFSTIDALVNNHGAGVKIAAVEDQSDDDIEASLNLNLSSVIRGSREVMKVMKPHGRGHIVNVTSVCAHHAWAQWSVYSAAKAGLILFTRCLHKEMAAWGGKATIFTPGAARTGFCDAAGIDGSWTAGLPDGKDFARTLVHCLDVPDNTVIEEVKVWGTLQVRDMINPY